MRIAQLTFHSFGQWEALGGKEGNWHTPSHPFLLLLAFAERLVKEREGGKFLQTVRMLSF